MKSFRNALDKALTAKDPKPKTYKKNNIKPSSLGSKCLRKNYYAFNGVPEDETDINPKSTAAMALGNLIEQMVIDFLIKGGITPLKYTDSDTLKSFNGQFPITAPNIFINKGFIDVVYVENGKLYLGEIKSTKDKKYKEIVKSKQPLADHKIQGCIYVYVFMKMLKDGMFSHIKELEGITEVESITYIYYNKDSSEFLLLETKKDDVLFKQIITKINLIYKHSQKKILPEKTWDYCDWCPYASKCKRNFNDL